MMNKKLLGSTFFFFTVSGALISKIKFRFTTETENSRRSCFGYGVFRRSRLENLRKLSQHISLYSSRAHIEGLFSMFSATLWQHMRPSSQLSPYRTKQKCRVLMERWLLEAESTVLMIRCSKPSQKFFSCFYRCVRSGHFRGGGSRRSSATFSLGGFYFYFYFLRGARCSWTLTVPSCSRKPTINTPDESDLASAQCGFSFPNGSPF